MKLIELRCDGNDLAINTASISSVYKYRPNKCAVYMTGEENPFYVDESYEEVLRLIKDVSDGD